MSETYKLYWGDMHHNTFQAESESEEALASHYAHAKEHLDFYGMAYYPAQASAFKPGGHMAELVGKQEFVVEDWKQSQLIEKEWAMVTEHSSKWYQPGQFVTFLGYEWQGNGQFGDHNVFYLNDTGPLYQVQTLPQLYEKLREHNAIAIPHHTAYRPGHRAPLWELLDEKISPMTEIFSIHGSSETDEEMIGMRQNAHMGPGCGGATYQDLLRLGKHVGAIGSTDHWGDLAGHYGQGLAGVYASELTRQGIWDAIQERRVYAVSGDRIELEFDINDAPMGSCITTSGPRQIKVKAVGCDAIDRIELLKDDTLIAVENHLLDKQMPPAGKRSKFKLRIEAGWGPKSEECVLEPIDWHCSVKLGDGTFIGYQPCWLNPGQTAQLHDDHAQLNFRLRQNNVMKPNQNATVLEFESTPEAEIQISFEGMEVQNCRVIDLLTASR
ncbi:MAG: DUF3604 domain-containing protein, partial [Phycisphaeraceae bacterium]|nr:DUF3604 domain-containing protein [Phycisphaeraceae bacterium]